MPPGPGRCGPPVHAPFYHLPLPDFETEVLPFAQSRGVAAIAMKTCGPGYFLPKHTTKPDRIDKFGPSREALTRPDIPTHREYLHYALSLPVATAVVGIDSMATLDGVVENASSFRPLSRAEMDAVSKRAQVFATTGYWIPRAADA